jgi:hypothetical protein
VEKQVFAAPRVDEPEASVRQPFDSSFGHLCVSLVIAWIDAARLTSADWSPTVG